MEKKLLLMYDNVGGMKHIFLFTKILAWFDDLSGFYKTDSQNLA